jgi:uncharacterized membrane protein YdcZ (DUF606 family)
MIAAILIDRFGWIGMQARPVDAPRIAGVILMVVSVVLINWGSWKRA